MTRGAFRPGTRVRFKDYRHREHEGIIYRAGGPDWFSVVDEEGTQWNAYEKDAEVLDADATTAYRAASLPQRNAIRRLAPELVPNTGRSQR